VFKIAPLRVRLPGWHAQKDIFFPARSGTPPTAATKKNFSYNWLKNGKDGSTGYLKQKSDMA
jgi:hypothetical protein